MSRLFAWSDLHVDYPENLRLVANLSDTDFVDDTLMVGGDVSSIPEKLLAALLHLKRKFRNVAFVPGNHDLWVSTGDGLDSWNKVHELRSVCRANDVWVEPFATNVQGEKVWIAPLFSWYLKPEEDSGSLYLEKPGEDPTLRIWSDNYRIRWPELPGRQPPALHLLSLNSKQPAPSPAMPTVTFSHFLPRVELVFSNWERFISTGTTTTPDPCPEFNFTRVAGCRQLDEQIRTLGSAIHVYGHQHRNRDRVIEGVRYVSHCLGYPPEWQDLDTQPPRHRPLEIKPAARQRGDRTYGGHA